MVKRETLNILVDSGNTHTIFDTQRAKRMRCVTMSITPVFVAVANGERLVCREVCRKFTWRIHEYEFSIDVLLLRLGGYDMVY